MRFGPVDPPAPNVGLRLLFEHSSDFIGERVHRKGLGENLHPLFEMSVSYGGVLSETRDEEHLEIGPQFAGSDRNLPAIQIAREANIGDEKVDGRRSFGP
jgi:hypothetical protein